MARKQAQQGWVLMSGIIFLVVMTLIALTAMRFATTTNQIVANIQTRNVTAAAAQTAIDTVINSRHFIDNPSAPVPVAKRNCSDSAANKVCIDTNGDGTVDIEVTIQKADTTAANKVGCTSFRPIRNGSLKFANPDDRGCAASDPTQLGMEKLNPDEPSLCAETIWDIRADARDLVTESRVVIHQGIAVRVDANNENECTP